MGIVIILYRFAEDISNQSIKIPPFGGRFILLLSQSNHQTRASFTCSTHVSGRFLAVSSRESGGSITAACLIASVHVLPQSIIVETIPTNTPLQYASLAPEHGVKFKRVFLVCMVYFIAYYIAFHVVFQTIHKIIYL